MAKRKPLVKGSLAAKRHMAKLRKLAIAKRKSGTKKNPVKGYGRANWEHHPAGGVIVYSGEPGRVFATYRGKVSGPYASKQAAFDLLTNTWDKAAGKFVATPKLLTPSQVKVTVWDERDRLHIAIVDRATEQKTIAEWWDDDAKQMFEDGFFKVTGPRLRGLDDSVIKYAQDMGLLAKGNPLYVGLKSGKREVFRHPSTPTEKSHGDKYGAVIGPFRTRPAAELMAGPHGPLIQTVSDAEKAVRSQRKINPVSGPADATAARELQLYIENEADLYRQQHLPIIANLMRKRAAGIYDHELAVKLFMYLVESGAKKYAKEFSTGTDWSTMFNKNTRLVVAASLRDDFEAEADLGSYTQYIPKKYQKNPLVMTVMGNPNNPGHRELQCGMKRDCKAVVTHIDEKGYIYCGPHGIQRRSYQRCRMLTPGELEQLKAGKPLTAYNPGPCMNPGHRHARRNPLDYQDVYSAAQKVGYSIHDAARVASAFKRTGELPRTVEAQLRYFKNPQSPRWTFHYEVRHIWGKGPNDYDLVADPNSHGMKTKFATRSEADRVMKEIGADPSSGYVVTQVTRARRNPGLQAFDVFLDGKHVDTVFYGENIKVDVDEVKRSLVGHDGYDPGIEVKKRRAGSKGPRGPLHPMRNPRKSAEMVASVENGHAIKAFHAYGMTPAAKREWLRRQRADGKLAGSAVLRNPRKKRGGYLITGEDPSRGPWAIDHSTPKELLEHIHSIVKDELEEYIANIKEAGEEATDYDYENAVEFKDMLEGRTPFDFRALEDMVRAWKSTDSSCEIENIFNQNPLNRREAAHLLRDARTTAQRARTAGTKSGKGYLRGRADGLATAVGRYGPKRQRMAGVTKIFQRTSKLASKNPGKVTRRKVTMTLEAFAKMVKAKNDPKLWAAFLKKVEAYKKWSHGTLPKKVTVEQVNVPGMSGMWMTYDAGKAPETAYVMPRGTKRKGAWVHQWDTMPDLKNDPESGIVLTKLKGKSRITDFYHR